MKNHNCHTGVNLIKPHEENMQIYVELNNVLHITTFLSPVIIFMLHFVIYVQAVRNTIHVSKHI